VTSLPRYCYEACARRYQRFGPRDKAVPTRRCRGATVACALLVLLTVPSLVSAQDSHYWTYQYGTRANLLGGTVIGSVVDISAVYYNPGALALIDDPQLLLTSKVFELTDFTAEGTENRPLQLNDLRIDEAPGFFGGTIPFNFLENHVLAYSVFTRHRQKLKVEAADVWSDNVVDGVSGAEDAFAHLFVTRDLSETWVGLSWSAPWGKFGVGASQFVAYRSQKWTRLVAGNLYNATVPAASASGAEASFSYWNARLLWKLGLSWEWESVSWGLTVTSPSLSVLGEGAVLANTLSLTQGMDSASMRDPVFLAACRDKLRASYQSPFSIGLGAAYGFGRSRVHVSAEYFGKNRQFTILDGGAFVGQSTGDTVALVLTEQQDDVLNFGVGITHRLSATLTGYASFRTDLSSADRDNTEASVSTPLNLYHVTVGTAVKIPVADVTLGLGYGWGGATIPVFLRQSIDNDVMLEQLPENLKTSFRSLRFIIAFSI
jgi:hypothetical protein